MPNQTNLEDRPWLTIWTEPRATVRGLVEGDPQYMVLVLASLGGVTQALGQAAERNLGDQWPFPAIVVLVLLAGPLFGILSLYLAAALIHWTGGWIGGSAPAGHIRTAVAWANVPGVFGLFLWVPALLLFGQELMTADGAGAKPDLKLALAMATFALMQVGLGIWSFVILLQGLGEVQGFSAWKAWGNLLLGGAVVVVPLGLLALVAAALAR